MSAECNSADIIAAASEIRSRSKLFLTNIFALPSRIEGWCTEGTLRMLRHRDSIILLRKDAQFEHIYFAARDTDSLYEAIQRLPLDCSRYVCDVIYRDIETDHLTGILCKAGLFPYKRLFRMVNTGNAIAFRDDDDRRNTEFAVGPDCEHIEKLLRSNFDPYAEQLPSTADILAAIQARRIVLVKQDARIQGLLFFEQSAMSATIRYWLVASWCRGIGVGAALMGRYFAETKGVRRHILWVIADNESAIAKYSHYQFRPDGLSDHVFCSKLIYNETYN